MFKGLVNQYSISKSIKFELIPQGETKDNLEKSGWITKDEQLSKDCVEVKKIIDEYHKEVIDEALKNAKLTKLKDFYEYYNKDNLSGDEKKKFNDIKKALRKEVYEYLKKHKKFNKLFSGKFISKDLPDYVCGNKEQEKLIKEFLKFTTYFKGFNENRKNIYSPEEKSTSICYRLINDNLPKFIDNINNFNKYIKPAIEKNMESDLKCLLGDKKLDNIFTLENFNNVLTQEGIDEYNRIIGGYELENGVKVKGINEHINLYNQNIPKKERIPKLGQLFKQILSDRNSNSLLMVNFDSDEEVLETIKEFHINFKNNVLECAEAIGLVDIIKGLNRYNLDKIYIKNDKSLAEISQNLFGNWSYINNKLVESYDKDNLKENNKISNKYIKEREKYFKNKESYSIGELNKVILNDSITIEEYFINTLNKIVEEIDFRFENFNNCIGEGSVKSLAKDKKKVQIIKDYLDKVKELQNFIKPLMGGSKEGDKDLGFYNDFEVLWNRLSELNPLYNKARNYMTRKPFSTEKIKLNFGNPELLGGWAKNKECDYSSILLKDSNFYYLGIMDKGSKEYFKNYDAPKNIEDTLYKMNYLQIADPSKDIQNLMVIDGKTVKKNGRKDENGENKLLEQLKNQYLPQEINMIRKEKTYSKLNSNFKKEDLIKFIDFYKERTKEYYSEFNFDFRESQYYDNFRDFTDHINQQAYQLEFFPVSKEYIYKLVREGKLYLFKIYNKDFSQNKKDGNKGTPNLHTIYWNMIFDKRNLENVVYKLDGGAEVFFRKKSIEDEKRVIHYANEKLNNKNKDNKKKVSCFSYDLIKDRRYTMDKFQFHVPITLNFVSKGTKNINEEVNRIVKANDDIHIMGIDRGERNLLYICIIDIHGNIKHQESLNIITSKFNNEDHKVDYHKLLEERQGSMEAARLNWDNIQSIKEIKEGYLSQCIHRIVTLMMEYKCIIAMEDLNFGFKRGRQKIDMNIYQKFEKMLIDKLNFLVDKKIEPWEIGGALKAYQLTNKFEGFNKLGKQSGILYYVPAWMTSKIDPTTGFVNLLYYKYENVDAAINFISKFNDITYNNSGSSEEERYFQFDLDYNNFTNSYKGTRKNWTICTYGTRVMKCRNLNNRNQWDYKEVCLTKEFINLFEKYGIGYNSDELKKEVLSQRDKGFLEELIGLINLTLQMRNSNKEQDYIISPVKNSLGTFYDSRKAKDDLPKDGDANGAYNIARKGLICVNKIKDTDLDKTPKPKLNITNEEWLKFAQQEKN